MTTITTTAWDLIGFDGSDGKSVRVVGGRTLYEAVVFNDETHGHRVRLDRLIVGETGLRVVNRYVDADTPVEVVEDPS
jgi:hypothetical protein